MTERALIRRELVRQTALLSFVFALLFGAAGRRRLLHGELEYLPKRRRKPAGHWHGIGLHNPRCRRQRIRDRRRRRGRRARRRRPLRRHGDRRPLPHASAEHRGRRSAVHHAHTKRAGRPSQSRGAVRSYPSSCAISPSTRTTSNASTRLPRGVTSTAASRMRQTTKARPRIFRRW